MISHENTLQDVIGKTIRSIVFRSGRDANPESQLFLVFDDNTYCELYGQDIHIVNSLSEGDAAKALDYARKFSREVFIVNGNKEIRSEEKCSSDVWDAVNSK